MTTAYLVITIIAAAANIFSAFAGWARVKFMADNLAELGVPDSWMPILSMLKLAGGLGLVAGLLWWQPLAIAAATGLIAFFLGAIMFHIRARVFLKIPFPGTFLGLALASLVLGLTG